MRRTHTGIDSERRSPPHPARPGAAAFAAAALGVAAALSFAAPARAEDGCPGRKATGRPACADLPPGHPPVGCEGPAGERPRFALPPGHPPVALGPELPPGHPPVDSAPRLPPGHPPLDGAVRLPPGHPPVEAVPREVPLFDQDVPQTL